MLCKKPLGVNGATVGCGYCGPCIANRRRLWTGRFLLEQMDHEKSCFATFTYVAEPATFVKEDLQKTWKLLRYYCGPFRYYAVGEKGTLKGRIHWHAAIFGVGIEDRGWIAKAWGGHVMGEVRKVPEGSFGGVHVGELNAQSAMYILKYMSKDWTEDCPVFMSRRPGIGAVRMRAIAQTLWTRSGAEALGRVGDVPRELRVGSRKFPIGRYLRGVLREAVGWDRKTPLEVRKALAVERSKESAEVIKLRSKKRHATAVNQEARVIRARWSEKL